MGHSVAPAEGLEKETHKGREMKLSALKFDTPDNACLSLRVIAELVRRGEMTVDPARHEEAPKWLRLEVYDLRERTP